VCAGHHTDAAAAHGGEGEGAKTDLGLTRTDTAGASAGMGTPIDTPVVDTAGVVRGVGASTDTAGGGEAYLRVLYNGNVITPRVLGCNGARQRGAGAGAGLARGAGEMCPLRYFERAMTQSLQALSCKSTSSV